MTAKNTKVDNPFLPIVSLCKRRGFIFQSSEIYGGIGSCYDYGPLGVELKNNIKDAWWKSMTYREDVVGIDAAILMHPQVWKASGHVDNFSDPMVDCKQCKARFRADKINLAAPCPQCGERNSFTAPRDFNLMFKTQMGAAEDTSSLVYLRPETAQGIFVNFQNVQNTSRLKLPFGIAQIGKAFRNEITPGNFIFRMREFEQMEMQYFVRPGTQREFFEMWKEIRKDWHRENGLSLEKLRFKDHGEQLAHYADLAFDIEFEFPIGFEEIEGIHSRTDFDLRQHQNLSGKNLLYVDQLNNNEKYLPFVVETSVGLDRTFLALLSQGFVQDSAANDDPEEGPRWVLKLKNHLAPIKIAVLPLFKKSPLEENARSIFKDLQKKFRCDFDASGSIGKRYRRQDEIGTPFCVTYDFESVERGDVTIRYRDSMKQERIPSDQLVRFFSDHF